MHSTLTETKPIVWTIASSDSGGGAGIQADLHTFAALGCHGCSVIAAVTAQNSTEVIGYEPVSTTLFITQLNCLLQDMPPKVIKIGLIPDAELLAQLVNWLVQHKADHQFVVIADPVLSSSSGYNFVSQSMLSIWRQQLLPLLDLITPNLPELAILSDLALADSNEQANQLLQWGVKAVLVKGGHGADTATVTDHYCSTAQRFSLQQPRLNTLHNHGTGCVLSSAIAAVHAYGYKLADSVIVARAYLQQALKHSYATGKGAGCLQHHSWPTKRCYFPQLILPQDTLYKGLSFTCISTPIGFYPVIDSLQWLKRLLPLEPDVIQLRIKQGSPDEIERQIAEAVLLSRDYKLRLFINDHWQLAIKYGAYGVHLGQEDLAQADLNAIAAAGLCLGISTHSYTELLRAHQLRPSYIALGHIFATQTKQMPSQPQGLTRLKHYAAFCDDIPTVAIGGINPQRLDAVLQCGVAGVAVVSAITAQTEPEQAFLRLKHQVEQYYAHHA
ncbi:hydroxymethylpyrimidine kinase/phosphomethylpyrimidine kinase/thiamine-phosphate diphosphorylase [Rheinheimera pacifica]|uniref:thiamine phosphate synthase n=1 Tax=Rheinheimera pacifica TaxID=173990 RepID=UPI002168C98D|nr:thiamine phosphate synthase [Rheinheimera pacifica]MCS4309074.1 hydroxymethylpyrimidine kinase/phosphomethylpyrimidine kinase/thiamine-phosphate diphosphorylase [Rheinheimera pacifica]